jgi:hypothetical protein
LKASEEPYIDRKGVEQLLQVSTTVAWRILKKCGAQTGMGSCLSMERTAFVRALEAIQIGEAAPEIVRHIRLEQRLQQERASRRAEKVQVAGGGSAETVVNTRFTALPEGVLLERQQLTVRFANFEEFMEKVGAVVYALQNDWEAVREFVGGGTGDSLGV